MRNGLKLQFRAMVVKHDRFRCVWGEALTLQLLGADVQPSPQTGLSHENYDHIQLVLHQYHHYEHTLETQGYVR